MTAQPISDASVVTTWRKSSHSGSENADCVEFAVLGDEVAARDSKNPTGPALVFPATEWTAFVTALTTGNLPTS